MSFYVVKYLVKVSEFGGDGLPCAGPNRIYGQVKIPAKSESDAKTKFWHMHENEPHVLGEALDTSEWTKDYEDVQAAIEDCIQTDENVSISEIVKA